jgi:uncharacterized damage-inducible protein DinB
MFASLLEEAIESWEGARHGVIAELKNIPADEYGYRPVPDVRSVAEQAAHVLEVAQLMVAELCSPDTNLKRLPWPDLLRYHAAGVMDLRDRGELLHALQTTLETGVARFREVGEIHMLQTMERFDGVQGTKLAWFHHGIAQEEYHRAQITVYERMLGIVPALTHKIQSMEG